MRWPPRATEHVSATAALEAPRAGGERITCHAVGTMVFSYTSSISICTPDPLAGAPGGAAAPALRVWPLALGVTLAAVVALVALGAAVAVVLLQLRRRGRRSEDLAASKAVHELARLGSGGAVVDSAQRAPLELVQAAQDLASRSSAGSPHVSGGKSSMLPPEQWRLRWLGPLSDEQVEVGPMLARPPFCWTLSEMFRRACSADWRTSVGTSGILQQSVTL